MPTHSNPTRFVPGDRVRTISETWGEDIVPIGATGTIIQPPPILSVAFDHDPHGDGSGTWAILDHQIEHTGKSSKARARQRRRTGQGYLLLDALRPSPARRN
jgi:hypothetical protein